jgi:DNA replication protein DnaC
MEGKRMNNQSTINHLEEMRLSHMAQAFRQQMNDQEMEGVSFSDRFGMLVDIEYTARKNNRLHKLIKNARFDQPMASVADINYRAGRKINKDLIDRLSSCEYIREAHNVIMLGATGAGKSYMACALGMEACKRFYTVKYVRLPELLTDLSIARASGIFPKTIKAYLKVHLLIIDEWLLVKITENEARDLLEIIHSRHKTASTIFCSQFAPAGWFSKIKDSTIADAILDRIVHDSYTLELKFSKKEDEKSMREIYGMNPQTK